MTSSPEWELAGTEEMEEEVHLVDDEPRGEPEAEAVQASGEDEWAGKGAALSGPKNGDGDGVCVGPGAALSGSKDGYGVCVDLPSD